MSNPPNPPDTPTVTPTVPVSVRDLAVWLDRSLFALEQISVGRVTLPPEAADSPSDRLLLEGQEAIRTVVGGLQRAGAPVPQRIAAPPPVSSDLAALNEIASPEICARIADLAAALRGVLPVAEALDQARGRWMPEARDHGDTPGTDAAERVKQMIAGLELQLDAPKGRD